MNTTFHSDLATYRSLITAINAAIRDFNELLTERVRIHEFSETDLDSISVIGATPWADQEWPHTALPGVYVLLAHAEFDSARLGAYIGKASLANMGARMWTHLLPHKTSDAFRMNDPDGEPFVIDFIIAYPIRNPIEAPLAAAAEEFIIRAVRDQLHLLNGTGNRR